MSADPRCGKSSSLSCTRTAPQGHAGPSPSSSPGWAQGRWQTPPRASFHGNLRITPLTFTQRLPCALPPARVPVRSEEDLPSQCTWSLPPRNQSFSQEIVPGLDSLALNEGQSPSWRTGWGLPRAGAHAAGNGAVPPLPGPQDERDDPRAPLPHQSANPLQMGQLRENPHGTPFFYYPSLPPLRPSILLQTWLRPSLGLAPHWGCPPPRPDQSRPVCLCRTEDEPARPPLNMKAPLCCG